MATTAKKPREILLSDYCPTDYVISHVDLKFWLGVSGTRVLSVMRMKARENAPSKELRLDGEKLDLKSIAVNERPLGSDDYVVDDSSLTIKDLPAGEFTVTIENVVNPEANTALDGLYRSGSIFCTQNEAQGFRKITYYLDRPDVMAIFTTTIVADKKECPVLLSNGNLIEQGDLDDGLHFATWHDPFPKPCYLYALVAGDLGLVRDHYTTASGRGVDLRIYCDPGNEKRCHHAMTSLKNSMKWDEERFGLEYDLDIYMIVAVDSFNMGAMENKGLNIFNSAYVLADQTSATDEDFLDIEAVIGHEYFHNWTGNRVTCRDWFQLTLKEGLTVYRDQEFSADLNSRVVQRVEDVEALRTQQFPEDAGPTAHPIKPKSYMEINNFYTATIYNKGAEIIRMIENFVGVSGFRRGMERYFELFDGQAVTTEDFIYAMSDANAIDLEQFKLWYDQAGTPSVVIGEHFDNGVYKLVVRQQLPSTPGQPAHNKKAHHFPLNFALLDEEGQDIALDCTMLEIREMEHEFTFDLRAAGYHHSEKPALSINRHFSAPVIIKRESSLDELCFLMSYDRDGFNRCEVAHRLAFRMIDSLMNGVTQLDSRYKEAYKKVLHDSTLDDAQKSLMLTIPSIQLIGQEYKVLRVDDIKRARQAMIKELARDFSDEMADLYRSGDHREEFSLDPRSMGKRSLNLTLLGFLCYSENSSHRDLVTLHYDQATTMTDEFGALSVIALMGGEEWSLKRQQFYQKWRGNTLVMQKLIRLIADRDHDHILDDLYSLEADPIYDANVPNLVRSLWGGFMKNLPQFHHDSGRGYEIMATKILEIDKKNPQIASRLSSAFRGYGILDEERKALMKGQLDRILSERDLSPNVYEIVSLTLGQKKS